MKKYVSKLIASILCFSFVLGMSPVYATESTQGGFEPGEYSEAVTMLNDLGILDDTFFASYDASIEMSRGEFAALSLAIMGLSDESKATVYEQKFSDVPADNPYAKEINFATSLGLFNGVSGSIFAPDEPVYITQALKVAVSMLGYKEKAEYMGGYPTGYLAVARELDIMSNVNMDSSSPALRGNIIVLMYNSLFADVMNINGIDNGSFSYEITEGANLLSHYHKIHEGEGVVNGNWEYSLIGNIEDANRIMINGNRYFTDSPRAIGVVGKNVKYYYKEISNSNVLLTLREYDNDVVVINANENYAFNYSDGCYTVTGIDKDYTFRLFGYDIVYNYGYISGNSAVNYQDILTPQSGTITLIDNNLDGLYDVICIEEADILLFKSYDMYNNMIYDSKSRLKDVILDDYDNVHITDINGATVDFSKVLLNTVVMVYKSYDSKTLRLVVCPDYVEGVVDEITDDGVILNGALYAFSDINRIDGLALGQTYKSIIFAGQSYKFYLNQFNQIVYHDTKATLNTGYIADIASVSAGLNSGVSAQIYTSGGELAEIKFADKVKIETISGRDSLSSTQVKERLQTFADAMYGTGVNPNARLFVQYGLNEQKEINHIVLPHLLDEQSEYDNPPDNYSFFKLDYILSKFQGPGTRVPADHATNSYGKEYHRVAYMPANRSAGLIMTMDNTCSVFYVPEFSNANYLEKNFSVASVDTIPKNTALSYFPEFDGSREQLEIYSTEGDVRLVNNIVWIKANGHAKSISNSAEDLALVTAVSNVVSQDGDSLVKITVLESKSTYDVYSDNLNILSRSVFEDTNLLGHSNTTVSPTIAANKSSIVPGDIIRFSLNADGYVEDIALMYDSENNMITYQSAAAFTKTVVQYRNTCGEVTDMYGNYAVLDVYDSDLSQKTKEAHIVSSYHRIYVYDYKAKEGRVGTAADVSVGDKVYLTMYYTSSTDGEIIIYKGGNDR